MITGELRSKVDAIWLEIFSAGSKASQYKHAHIVFFLEASHQPGHAAP